MTEHLYYAASPVDFETHLNKTWLMYHPNTVHQIEAKPGFSQRHFLGFCSWQGISGFPKPTLPDQNSGCRIPVENHTFVRLGIVAGFAMITTSLEPARKRRFWASKQKCQS